MAQRILGMGDVKGLIEKFGGIEEKIDPVTIFFLDKYCKTLSAVANNAEKTAKYLRLLVRKKYKASKNRHRRWQRNGRKNAASHF